VLRIRISRFGQRANQGIPLIVRWHYGGYEPGRGEMWSEAEIEEPLRESRLLSSQELLQRMLQFFDQFAASAEQSDDIIVLALRAV
jgi:hypothetical protein